VALDSVFAQTFSAFEVIVVNDGSPDTRELEKVLEPYASGIRYVALPRNRGAGAALNVGISRARGRYLAFLDADDRWHPEFLERQLRFLEASPSRDLVYADALISGDSPLAGHRFMEQASSEGDVTLRALIEQRCTIILSTVVVRRAAIDRAGTFDETLRRGHDFDLWLRLARTGASMHYQRVVLAERRVRADGLSGDSIAELERALNVLDHFGHRHSLDAEIRTALRARALKLVDQLEVEQGKRRFLEGNFAAARYHLAASRERSAKVRLALVALKVAPRLVRATYLRLRPSAMPGASRGHGIPDSSGGDRQLPPHSSSSMASPASASPESPPSPTPPAPPERHASAAAREALPLH
jgi:glycosyltransferase involved in cell wall biosynthesis